MIVIIVVAIVIVILIVTAGGDVVPRVKGRDIVLCYTILYDNII